MRRDAARGVAAELHGQLEQEKESHARSLREKLKELSGAKRALEADAGMAGGAANNTEVTMEEASSAMIEPKVGYGMFAEQIARLPQKRDRKQAEYTEIDYKAPQRVHAKVKREPDAEPEALEPAQKRAKKAEAVPTTTAAKAVARPPRRGAR
jgi:hypothetical protein